MTSSIPESPVDRDALALLRAAYAPTTRDSDPFPQYLYGLENFLGAVDDVVEVLRERLLSTTRGGGVFVGTGAPVASALPLAKAGDIYIDLATKNIYTLKD